MSSRLSYSFLPRAMISIFTRPFSEKEDLHRNQGHPFPSSQGRDLSDLYGPSVAVFGPALIIGCSRACSNSAMCMFFTHFVVLDDAKRFCNAFPARRDLTSVPVNTIPVVNCCNRWWYSNPAFAVLDDGSVVGHGLAKKRVRSRSCGLDHSSITFFALPKRRRHSG